jgi:DNA-binding MarR family transcriptional regulator
MSHFTALRCTPRAQTESLTEALRHLGHLFEVTLNQELTEQGLTARQFNALWYIEKYGYLSRTALAQLLHTTAQAAGALAGRLHQGGFLERIITHPSGPIVFGLTEAGKQRLSDAIPLVAEAEGKALATLPRAAAANLVSSIEHLSVEMLANVNPEPTVAELHGMNSSPSDR